jgi:hypothetical protein
MTKFYQTALLKYLKFMFGGKAEQDKASWSSGVFFCRLVVKRGYQRISSST